MPVEGDDELKRTNEIKMAAPLLDAIDIQGQEITADALLTQRKFAAYLNYGDTLPFELFPVFVRLGTWLD